MKPDRNHRAGQGHAESAAKRADKRRDRGRRAEVASLERQYQQPRDKILELLRPNLGSLVEGIVRSKTIDFLLDSAKLLEATPAART